MLVLNLPFKLLMFITLMRPSLVLFLVIWVKLVKDLYRVCFFFFQAEDGIRDRDVTGVQTCALPICRARGRVVSRTLSRRETGDSRSRARERPCAAPFGRASPTARHHHLRRTTHGPSDGPDAENDARQPAVRRRAAQGRRLLAGLQLPGGRDDLSPGQPAAPCTVEAGAH